MEVVYERCCGMDIHKAKDRFLLFSEKESTRDSDICTMTGDLIEFSEWLFRTKDSDGGDRDTRGSYGRPFEGL